MTATNSIILPQPKTHNIPLWRKLLHKRGLSDSTIDHFCITRGPGRGWHYPVNPNHGAIRWKAFNSDDSPKYKWLPTKPDDVQFYDPHGKLKDYIAETNGDLILVEGEPNVWILWEAGVKNATCIL